MKHNNVKIQNEICNAVQKFYGFTPSSIEFIPVGEESYAYIVSIDRARKYFVKYCQHTDVIKNIHRVNDVLIKLKNLPFVVPPIDANGKASFDVMQGKMYAYPYIEGQVVQMGNDQFDKNLVDDLTKIIATIHTTPITIDLPHETFQNDFSTRFKMLRESPFEPNVRQLLIENEKVIRDLIHNHDEISKKYLSRKPTFVLTHGDITGLNLIRSKGGLKLVDWDGTMLAPRERDIMFLYDNPHFSLDAYAKLTNQAPFEPELKEFYSQDWSLHSIIGNFESISNNGQSKGDKSEYIDEINEYLGYYK